MANMLLPASGQSVLFVPAGSFFDDCLKASSAVPPVVFTSKRSKKLLRMVEQKPIQYVLFMEARHSDTPRAAICRIAGIRVVSVAEILQSGLHEVFIPDWVKDLATSANTARRCIGRCSLLEPPFVTSLDNMLQQVAQLGCPTVQNHHISGVPFVQGMVVWQRPAGNHGPTTHDITVLQNPSVVPMQAVGSPVTHPELPGSSAQDPSRLEVMEQQRSVGKEGTVERRSAQAPAAAVDTSPMATASSGPGACATALVKQEVETTLVTSQQMEYWMLADKPYRSSELQCLIEDYLLPKQVTRDRTSSTRSGTVWGAVMLKKIPGRVNKDYPLLAPKLQQLYLQVQQAHRSTAVPAAAAEAGPSCSRSLPASWNLQCSDASQKLLRILRCLKLWESRQATEPDMPQMLQKLAKSKTAGHSSSLNELTAAEAEAASGVESVVEYVDLTKDDDDGEGDTTSLQQLLRGEVDVVLLREVGPFKSQQQQQQQQHGGSDSKYKEPAAKRLCVKREPDDI